jgi:hypothetical protein
MRSISFITVVAAAAALILPAAAHAGSSAVFQVHGMSDRVVAGSDAITSVGPVAKRRPRQVLAGSVRSVSRRLLVLTLADQRELEIPAASLVRGRHGRRLLRVLQPGDRVVAVMRLRRGGGVRVRLVPLPADGEEDRGYDPGQYEGGEYAGGDYEGGDYEGGDYDPGDHDSTSQANGGPRD